MASRLFMLALCITALGIAVNPIRAMGAEAEDPWLSAWQEQVKGNRLYLYAVKLFKAPTGREGKVTGTFDDIKYGIVKFTFAGGGVLEIETFPPESSRVTLRVPQGFSNDKEAGRVLEQYVREIGLEIDWSKPREEASGEIKTLYYEHEEPAYNATAVMVYKGTKLIEIGFSMAL